MHDIKLFGMEPGLIKINYSFRGNPQEELALIMTHSLADCVSLPNDALYYRGFLRDGMKHAIPNRGLKPMGPFSGPEVRDEHIEKINRRVIQLTPSFFDLEKNFNHLLIAGNSPYFRDAINEVKRTLSDVGFNVDTSTWENYKTWEAEKLKTF